MNITTVAIFVVTIAAIGATIRGLFTRQRSTVGGVIALGVAVFAAVGAWYAWAETHSITGSVVYTTVVIASFVSAARQFLGGVRGVP
jgi:hypothetical protein